MHAECAEVSGLGYYAAGPLLDVQDVPANSQASFRPLGVTGLSNQRLERSWMKRREWPLSFPEQEH
jgi:hypothetical protein